MKKYLAEKVPERTLNVFVVLYEEHPEEDKSRATSTALDNSVPLSSHS
jgi:hypothetical protein